MTLQRGRLAKRTEFGPLRRASVYLVDPLDAPVFPIDVTEGITDWGMCGNDVWGDCGAAAEWHLEMASAKAAGAPVVSPTDETALNRYKEFAPATTPPGPGLVLATYLLELFKVGEIKAFAPVDQTNQAEMQAFVAAGFGLYVGVSLNRQAETQFNSGEAWDVGPGEQADPTDGHCVLWSKSESAIGPHGFVTWGKLQTATQAWVQECLVTAGDGEAFLVVTTEEDLAKFTPQLLADVAALAGTGGAS